MLVLGALEEIGEENLFIKKPQLGASTQEAYDAAKARIAADKTLALVEKQPRNRE